MESFIAKVRKNGDNHYISIPKNVVDVINLREEDLVKITLENVNIKKEDE